MADPWDTDLPADVRTTLSQLLAAASEAARERRENDVYEVVATVRTVAENKVPPGALKEILRHGCGRVEATVADEPLVAAEYADSLHAAVERTDR